MTEIRAAHNTGLAKVVVQCSALTFVVNPDCYRDATFAKLETVIGHLKNNNIIGNNDNILKINLAYLLKKFAKTKKYETFTINFLLSIKPYYFSSDAC
jgi:hypothetical protein